MCKQLGTEPDMDEIPPELKDFPECMQIAVDIYNMLPSSFTGGMESSFIGKDLSTVATFFEIFQVEGVEEKLLAMKTLCILNKSSITQYNQKKSAKQKLKTK